MPVTATPPPHAFTTSIDNGQSHDVVLRQTTR
jgi:hypothetical protein